MIIAISKPLQSRWRAAILTVRNRFVTAANPWAHQPTRQPFANLAPVAIYPAARARVSDRPDAGTVRAVSCCSPRETSIAPTFDLFGSAWARQDSPLALRGLDPPGALPDVVPIGAPADQEDGGHPNILRSDNDEGHTCSVCGLALTDRFMPNIYSFHAAAPNGSSFSSALASRHAG
jgi:hypothetical protein